VEGAGGDLEEAAGSAEIVLPSMKTSTVPSMRLYDSDQGWACGGGPLSRGPVSSKTSNAPPVSADVASTRMVSPTT